MMPFGSASAVGATMYLQRNCGEPRAVTCDCWVSNPPVAAFRATTVSSRASLCARGRQASVRPRIIFEARGLQGAGAVLTVARVAAAVLGAGFAGRFPESTSVLRCTLQTRTLRSRMGSKLTNPQASMARQSSGGPPPTQARLGAFEVALPLTPVWFAHTPQGGPWRGEATRLCSADP